MARLHTIGNFGDLSTVGKCEFAAVGTGQTREATIVRPGDKYAMKISSLSSGVRQGGCARPGASTNGTHYYFNFGIRVATRPSAQNWIWGVATSSTVTPGNDINIRLLSTGELEFRDNTTVLYTSAVLTLNTWYNVAVRFKRDASTPNAGADELELKIDGVQVYTSTTANIASAHNGMILGGNLNAEAQTQGEWYFSASAFNDSTGGNDNSWPSITERITYLMPDGTGTHDEPTPNGAGTNWECVDEDSPDGTTTYANMSANSANWSSAGSRFLVTLTSSASAGIGSGDAVTQVSVGIVWSSASAAGSTVTPGLRSGGTTADAGTGNSITTTTDSFLDDAIPHYTPQYTDPGAAAWTPTKLDSLEVGGRGSDTSPNCQVTTVWALIAYEPAVASGGGEEQRQPIQGTFGISKATRAVWTRATTTSALCLWRTNDDGFEAVGEFTYQPPIAGLGVLASRARAFRAIAVRAVPFVFPADAVVLEEPSTWTVGPIGTSALGLRARDMWRRAATMRFVPALDPYDPPIGEPVWTQPVQGTGSMARLLRQYMQRAARAIPPALPEEFVAPVVVDTWIQQVVGTSGLRGHQRRMMVRALRFHAMNAAGGGAESAALTLDDPPWHVPMVDPSTHKVTVPWRQYLQRVHDVIEGL